jgi:hypothetical protein
MSQLGRIGGQVLTDNLLRAGVDLAFNNDLVFLDVTDRKIGVNTDTPIYDLDVNSDLHTINLTVDTPATIGNIRINAPDTFTTTVGGIHVHIAGSEIWHDRLTTANLVVDGNKISSISNSNIVLDPNGSGTVELLSDTYVTGDVSVTGNIRMSGDLKALGTLTIGDNTFDTVTVNTDFTQDVVLSDNELYTLGTPTKRWERVYQSDWTVIGTAGSGIITQNLVVSDQLRVNGTTSTITALQSNDDLLLNTDSGINRIENIAFEINNISNIGNTPLLFQPTGLGYLTFGGDNGFVVPYGTNAERSSSPEQGETRWNTEEGILECFDGNVWAVSTGGGIEVTQELMYDIGNIWTLVLG